MSCPLHFMVGSLAMVMSQASKSTSVEPEDPWLPPELRIHSMSHPKKALVII